MSEVAAPTPVAPAQPSATPTAPVSPGPDVASIIGELVGVGIETPSPETTAEGTPEQGDKPAVPSVDDALDEALFDDSKPWDAERVKNVAKLLKAERTKIFEFRTAAHKMHSQALALEAKFKKTKDRTLSEKASIQAEKQRLDAELKALMSGDADAKLGALARLMGRNDGAELFKELTINLASGGKLRPAPQGPSPVEERLARLEEMIQSGASLRQAQEEEAQVEQLEQAQVQFARESTEHQYVTFFAKQKPDDVRRALTNIRMVELRKTGRPIDAKAACDILEAELKAQYQLFQGVTAAPQGQNGVRGTTGPEPAAARATANPAQAQSTPNRPTQPALIPAGLSGESSVTQRPLNTTEENEAIARALPDAFFAQFGFGQ